MAIGSTWRGNGPGHYELISAEELFAHFSEIQARGLLGRLDGMQPELNVAAGTNN